MFNPTITERKSAQLAFCEHYHMTEEQAQKYRLDYLNVRQLRKAQAWIITDSDGNKWLQSYNTIVSVWWSDTRTCQHFGRWSTTTSKHQTWFEREV